MHIRLFMLQTMRKAEEVGVYTMVSTPIYKSSMILRLHFIDYVKIKKNHAFIKCVYPFES